MKILKIIFFALLILTSSSLNAQRKLTGTERRETSGIGVDGVNQNNNTDGTKVNLSGKTKYTDYKVFSHKRDTSYIDTTLSLKKEYTYNYLRKDNFELLQFHNQGQTYNNLGYEFGNLSRFPDIGFSAKQFPYLNIEDIAYYEVPTPTTQITYKTGLQQGQFVDAIFTLNFNKRFNVSMSYKGLRSLGAYRRSLVSNGNFRTTFGYRTKEDRYEIRGHIVTQDFFHQESGGLTSGSLASFIDDDPDFSQRSRLDVNLNDTENQFNGSRLYIEQRYSLFSNKKKVKNTDSPKDSIASKRLNEIQDSIAQRDLPKDSLSLKKGISLKDSLSSKNIVKSNDSIQSTTKFSKKNQIKSKSNLTKDSIAKPLQKQDSILKKKSNIVSDSISRRKLLEKKKSITNSKTNSVKDSIPLKKTIEKFDSIDKKPIIAADSISNRKPKSKKNSVNQKETVSTSEKKTDSVSSKPIVYEKRKANLKIGHIFTSETKSYRLIQPTDEISIFGPVSNTNPSDDTAISTLMNNEFNLEFNSKYILGTLKAKAHLTSMTYGYDTILNSTVPINNVNLSDDVLSLGASWNARIKNFNLNAEANVTPGSSLLSGNFFTANATYKKDSLFSMSAHALVNSKSPNFNTLLHLSKYDDYNWENNFSNVNTQHIGFSLRSKWINSDVSLTNIDNFTYFDEDNLPKQYDNQVTYLKVKVNREIRYRKFGLDNTVMYQNVSNGSEVFRVPEIVTRNTFYYADHWFKGKPMYVNIGVTFKYFTSYFANAYNPVLAEFTLQNNEEIGFPRFDVFFNARVQRTRLFLKVDNISSAFTEKNYFSAPNYPFRDFTVRFGLVWNWFI